MRLDVDKYMPMLDGYNMPDAQKAELIQSLWHVMENFVDRAFGIHPLHHGETKTDNPNLQIPDKGLDLEISQFLTDQFARAAAKGEGVQPDERE